MLNKSNLYGYQKKAIRFSLTHPKSMLWMGCGLGKSICVLSCIKELLEQKKIKKALIVAPINVVLNVWKQEAEKWEHTKDLRISLVVGTEKQRLKALQEEADIYCISRDLLHWLFPLEWFKCDYLCIDESSGFKDRSTRRVSSLLQKSITVGGKKLHRKNPMIDHFKYVCECTGTPASESYSGLWTQAEIVAHGGMNPLGKTLTEFKQKYMVLQNFNGYPVYTRMRNGAIDEINDKLDKSGLCISMRTEDYIDLPEKIDIVRYVNLDDKRYELMNKNSIITVDKTDIIANSALDKVNKLQQISSGKIYDEQGVVHTLNKCKEEALKEILEGVDEPVLIMYKYNFEKEMLMKLGGVPLDNPKAISSWNAGKIRIGLLYPSTAYGLNIQGVCSIIIWYTQTLSGEQTEQAIKRIWRQGQKKTVRVFYLNCRNTVDELVYNLIREKKNILDELLKYFSV